MSSNNNSIKRKQPLSPLTNERAVSREMSVNSNNRPDGEEPAVQEEEEAPIPCSLCGHQVPARNWAVHQPVCQRRHSYTNESQEEESYIASNRSEETSNVAFSAHQPQDSSNMLESRQQQHPEASTQQHSSSSNNEADSSSSQWECSRCTLLNPMSSNRCEACLAERPHNNADNESPSTRQHVVITQGSGLNNSTLVRTATNSMVAGAILGSAFGPVGSIVGATALTTLGVLTHQWLASALDHNNNNNDTNGGQQQQPRMQITTRTLPGGGRFVMIRSSGMDMMPPNFGHDDLDRMILQMLQAHASAQGAGHPEQLSYEELLERFGVGTDHRGASDELLQSLPCIKLTESSIEKELPKESERTCGICLEDFQPGEEVRKLSCGHVLHKTCGDRWFRRVASCPICKRELQQSPGSGIGQKRQ